MNCFDTRELSSEKARLESKMGAGLCGDNVWKVELFTGICVLLTGVGYRLKTAFLLDRSNADTSQSDENRT